jgi:protein-disulfide isomerase
MSLSAILAALRSRMGLALLVPAVLLAGAAVVIAKSGPVRAPVAADWDQAPPQRKAIEAMIKDYLLKNPEIMLEVQAALEIKMEKIQAEKTTAALKSHAADIFRPEFSPVVGNPKGDVTIVEFFDYNCGYCKKALPDIAKLIEQEKGVKVVLKELPMFKGSDEAAKAALAAKMQGKYWEFHSAMLSTSGQANEASALRVAQKIGLDIAKLKKDMASPEVAKELDDTRLLAEKLQVRGTPFFMVADRIIPGAPVDLLDQMAKHVADVRQEGGCKIC